MGSVVCRDLGETTYGIEMDMISMLTVYAHDYIEFLPLSARPTRTSIRDRGLLVFQGVSAVVSVACLDLLFAGGSSNLFMKAPQPKVETLSCRARVDRLGRQPGNFGEMICRLGK